MKHFLLAFFLFAIIACVPKEEPVVLPDNCYLCETIPQGGPATLAEGEISQQNAGPKRVFQVAEASIVWIENNVFSLKYWFTSEDCLELIIAEVNQDYNYHYPKPPSENQILEVYFNENFIELRDAALSLQPRPDDGGFHTVVNVHTLDFGDWNGTVNRVPYLE